MRRHVVDVSLLSLVAILGFVLFFPVIANADPFMEKQALEEETVSLLVAAMQNETRAYGSLPEAGWAPPRRHYTIPMTAYTSDPRQTDDAPCITASGLDVCERDIENVVAANFLPIGTRVRIPELFGDRVFYVEDRMNARYQYKMDIWMKEIQEARKFGVKYTTIEVF